MSILKSKLITDIELLKLAENLYDKYDLSRLSDISYLFKILGQYNRSPCHIP